MRTKKKRLIWGISIAAVVTFLTISPLVASQIVFENFFNKRITTYEPLWFKIDDFDGLKRDKYTFTSNHDQTLTGYMYHSDLSLEQKGLIVLAHGYGGGGQRTYMDCTNYLCSHGYYVFAYDATGNDESEGKGIQGFPQGIIDVNHAIDFVKTLDSYKSYPLFLFGHSWGGYSVTNSLYFHPEIKAVVSLSGFNQSSALIRTQGQKFAPGIEESLMPYVGTYEQAKFGKLTNSTAMRAFKNSTANVFIIHSQDDDVVPFKTGYKIYYQAYKDDPRFMFQEYENRGHGTVYYSDFGKQYTEDFEKCWNEFLTDHPNEEEKIAYINEHIDRDIWNNRLDTDLFTKIITFYDSNI